MTPDFRAITLKELRDYLKVNRADDRAWDIYFDRIDAESQKSLLYDAPKSAEELEQSLKAEGATQMIFKSRS